MILLVCDGQKTLKTVTKILERFQESVVTRKQILPLQPVDCCV